jgi:predicted nucleotidyltransferase
VGVSEGETVFSAPGIVVKTPAVAQLLAMKLSAWRDDVDIADARRLLETMSGEPDELWTKIEPYVVPGSELKAQYAFLDLWEALYGAN